MSRERERPEGEMGENRIGMDKTMAMPEWLAKDKELT